MPSTPLTLRIAKPELETAEEGTMRCHRCDNLMFPVDLLDEGGGLTSNTTPAWRCFACGDIVDHLIFANRRHAVDPQKRSPRFSIAMGISH